MSTYNFAFSYSRWSLWKKCPKAYKLMNIDKIDVGPPGPGLVKGRKVHDEVAAYIEGKGAAMPESLASNFSKLGDDLRTMHKSMQKGVVQVEKQLAFNRDIRPCSWFGAEAWARFIWDVLVVDAPKVPDVTYAAAVDWKTGKPYGSYDEQMQIFALPAFWMYPNLQRFTGHLLYLDTGDDKDFEITREQFYGGVERTWIANIKMMEADLAFPATPSRDSCKFCEFGRKNLNICEDYVQ